MPRMLSAALQMQEYWRYLLTGIPTIVLLGLFCRFIGRMITPFAEWVTFTGSCITAEQTEQGVLLRIRFTDRNRLTHTAAFLTDHSHGAAIRPDDTVKIALHAKAFTAGEYPDTTPEPIYARSIFLAVEQKQLLRRVLLKELVIGVISCGAAFALFYFAMQTFF